MSAGGTRAGLDAHVTRSVLLVVTDLLETFPVLSVSASHGVERDAQGAESRVLRFRVECADESSALAVAECLGVDVFGPKADIAATVEWSAWTGALMFGVAEPSGVEGVHVAVVCARSAVA